MRKLRLGPNDLPKVVIMSKWVEVGLALRTSIQEPTGVNPLGDAPCFIPSMLKERMNDCLRQGSQQPVELG